MSQWESVVFDVGDFGVGSAESGKRIHDLVPLTAKRNSPTNSRNQPGLG